MHRSPQQRDARPAPRTQHWPRARWLGAALFVLGALSAAAPSQAQTRPKKKTAPAALDLSQVAAALKSRDPAQISAGLAAVVMAGKQAAPLLSGVEKLLAQGLPVLQTEQAFVALAILGAPSSASVIAPYVLHRAPRLRQAALRALASIESPLGREAMVRALSDGDVGVRLVAIESLGRAGSADVVPALLTAFDEGLHDAAPVAAKLCDGPTCEALAPRITVLRSLSQLSETMTHLASRAGLSLDERTMLAAIGSAQRALAAIDEARGGAGALLFERLLTVLPSQAPDSVREALREAAQ